MGRPLKVIDWKTVANLCEIQCIGEEIASVIEVDYVDKAFRNRPYFSRGRYGGGCIRHLTCANALLH